MKIAVLVEHFPPKMGSDRRIYELMKRLTQRHQINFLQVPSFRELCGILNTENFTTKPAKTIYAHEGIVAHRLRIPCKIQFLWIKSFKLAYVLSMFLLFPIVVGKLRKINPNVIVLNYPSVYTGMLGFFAAKLLRKPCVVDFNDLIAQYTINLLKLKKSSLSSRILIKIQDFIVKHSKAVVVPTDFIKKYAVALGCNEKKINVVPNGVDTQVFHWRNTSNYRSSLNLNGKNVCVYFGRLEEWAGSSILKEVSGIIEQKRPDVRLLIAGGGSAEPEFSQNVIMIKEVPHCEVPKIIAVADVVLVPFPKNEVSHAASPLKLFEAMAMGKPVIASGVSGIRDVVESGYNGLLVDSNNPEEWVAAVETVLNSKMLQLKLGKNAGECAKNYDWSVLAYQFETVLSSLN